MSLKRVVKKHVPPSVFEWLKRTYQRVYLGGVEWEFCPDGWMITDPKIKGWNVDAISKAQKAKWPQFLRVTQGTGPLGIAHEAASPRDDDHYAHHLVMAYAYALALAGRRKDRVSLLDWGGGIGHYCILSHRLLPDLDLEYYCKDLPLICRVGREVLPEAQFIERDEEVAARRYDLVLASGSLQCVEDWKSVARLLASVSNPYLYVTRLPVVRRCKSFVVRQRVYAYGYDTEYLSWIINREEFLEYMASLDLELVREFVFHEHAIVRKAPEQAEVRGFLFRSRNNWPAASAGSNLETHS